MRALFDGSIGEDRLPRREPLRATALIVRRSGRKDGADRTKGWGEFHRARGRKEKRFGKERKGLCRVLALDIQVPIQACLTRSQIKVVTLSFHVP